MLFLASDHHKSFLVVRVLDDAGQCVEQRRLSTHPAEVDRFLARIAEQAADQGGFIAMFEECGFTLWFERKLEQFACRRYIKIQPLKRQPQKTDRRDATQIAELLWANRQRILSGQQLLNIRQVPSPSEEDRQARVRSKERQQLRADRRADLCRIQDILRRFNLQHDCPTKGLLTKAGRRWLQLIELPSADRARLDRLVARIEFLSTQIEEVEAAIGEQADRHPAAQVLMTVPGVAHVTGLATAAWIGPIDRFARPASLANFLGLTPAINDSGESVGRIGSITKRGNSLVRGLLGQVVYHVLRHDADFRKWHRKIRKRRGGKTAMVASMRRLVCIIWHMLKNGETYDSVRATRRVA